MQACEKREAGSEEACEEERSRRNCKAAPEMDVAHSTDGRGSGEDEGGILVTAAIRWFNEAKECGESRDILKDEGAAFIGDQSSLFVDLPTGL